MKTCPCCKQSKPPSEFNTCSRRKDGLSAYCRSCASEKGKAYYANNKAKVLLRTNARGTRVYWENRESALAANKAYRQRNSVILAERKRVRRDREKDRAWARKNRSRKAEQCRAYDARKKSACPFWASREAMREFYVEAQRLTKSTGVRHEVDHIIPLNNEKVCGLHCEFNLRVITKSENAAKCNRWAA